MDAQQELDELLRWAAPMILKAGGRLVCPDLVTCVPGAGKSRRLDYFIVDSVLANATVQ